MSSERTERVAIFPGSFDPPTLGHFDVLQRGTKLFDKIIVGILNNPEKRSLLSPQLRCSLYEEQIKAWGLESKISVEAFSGLAVHFAEVKNAGYILRGVRSSHDVDFELPMALSNRSFSRDDLETIFLPTAPAYCHVQGTLVRQIATGGGDLQSFVSPEVAKALKAAVENKSSS